MIFLLILGVAPEVERSLAPHDATFWRGGGIHHLVEGLAAPHKCCTRAQLRQLQEHAGRFAANMLLATEESGGHDAAEPRGLRALIVEPRDHPALGIAVNATCAALGVPISIFHGTLNGDAADAAADASVCVDHVVSFNAAGLDAMSYSKLLLDANLWASIDAAKVVVFQTDGVPCDGSTRAQLEQRFGRYDYCGAPWGHDVTEDEDDYSAPLLRVGNGGFSLHDVATARRQIATANMSNPVTAEDVVWSSWCAADPRCKPCPPREARAFSVEELPGPTDGSPPFGFHRPWAGMLPNASLSYLATQCPLVNELRRLNEGTGLHDSGGREPARVPFYATWTVQLTTRRPALNASFSTGRSDLTVHLDNGDGSMDMDLSSASGEALEGIAE